MISEPIPLSCPTPATPGMRKLTVTVNDRAKKRGKKSQSFTIEAPVEVSARQVADHLKELALSRPAQPPK